MIQAEDLFLLKSGPIETVEQNSNIITEARPSCCSRWLDAWNRPSSLQILEPAPVSWKINAALAAALFALVTLIFLIPMEHDLALMLGLVPGCSPC